MIVAGRVSQKMAPVLRQIYDQMAEPKWVISMGVCASSGGMFNNYAIVQGVDHIVPVDIYLPGCPPRPEMLLDAIVKLHDKIQNMKLGVNRENEITELEQARLRRLPLLPHLQASCRRRSAEAASGERARKRQARRGPGRGGDRGPRAARRAGRPHRHVRHPHHRRHLRLRRPAGPQAAAAVEPAPLRLVLRRGRRRARQRARGVRAELRRRGRAGGRGQRRADLARAPRAPGRGREAAARRPGPGVRALPRRLRHPLPAPTPAPSCTPSTTCSRSPTTGGCGWR